MRNLRLLITSGAGLSGAAASLFAGVCCVIPALSAALVAVLGVGGAVGLAALAPYRPWMMAGSAALLAFSLYASFARPCARAARLMSIIGATLWVISLSAWIFLA